MRSALCHILCYLYLVSYRTRARDMSSEYYYRCTIKVEVSFAEQLRTLLQIYRMCRCVVQIVQYGRHGRLRVQYWSMSVQASYQMQYNYTEHIHF
jgi:hypothetical protein